MGTTYTIHIKCCRRTVTTAGTAEPFERGAPGFFEVKAITIRAYTTNVGNLYVGDSNRVSAADYSYILAPGEPISLDVTNIDKWAYLDLTQIWIDADTDANGVCFIALVDREPW